MNVPTMLLIDEQPDLFQELMVLWSKKKDVPNPFRIAVKIKRARRFEKKWSKRVWFPEVLLVINLVLILALTLFFLAQIFEKGRELARFIFHLPEYVLPLGIGFCLLPALILFIFFWLASEKLNDKEKTAWGKFDEDLNDLLYGEFRIVSTRSEAREITYSKLRFKVEERLIEYALLVLEAEIRNAENPYIFPCADGFRALFAGRFLTAKKFRLTEKDGWYYYFRKAKKKLLQEAVFMMGEGI